MNIQEEFNKVQRELKRLEEKHKEAARLYDKEMRNKQDIEKIIALNESKKLGIERTISKIEPEMKGYKQKIQDLQSNLERLKNDLNAHFEDRKKK